MLTVGHRQYPALVLNADFRPLSYYPLSLCSWQEAIRAVYLDRVTVLNEYDDVKVHSPSRALAVPSVIALKEFVESSRKPAFTRFNVFLRDNFRCQYCNTQLPAQDLTFDHVIPRCRGGRTNWENVVTACSPCNLAKGGKLPEDIAMAPLIRPARPSTRLLHTNGRQFPPNYLHKSWRDYLYWDSVLES